MNDSAPPSQPQAASSKALIVMFVITLCAVGLVVFLLFRPTGYDAGVVESQVPAEEVETLQINRGEVIDAVHAADVAAEEGRQYYVVIQDVSRDGASGVARIGGLVTFVRNTQPQRLGWFLMDRTR